MTACRHILFLGLLFALPAAAQKFYPDDPLINEPTLRPVGQMATRGLSDVYDLFRNSLATPGELQPSSGIGIRARSVNTLGDPMQGSWWEKRHYWTPLTPAQLRHGPDGTHPPSTNGKWKITSAKSEGVTPGFVIVDPAGTTYFVKFDPSDYPELSSAADHISGKIFHALGYHVPDNYIVEFPASLLEIAADAKLTDAKGLKRHMIPDDLGAILRRAARAPSGLYRATASRALPGKP
ncbi:MAG TPA: hypothetical protein PLZ95_18320, partial [Bryobacteraceae bacterium]|nr:hypothetical protein [Bryobacteraceae bacterium]